MAYQHEMSCVKHSLTATYPPPLCSRSLQRVGFAVGSSLELQHRVTGNEDRVAGDALGYILSFRGSQPQREPGRLGFDDE